MEDQISQLLRVYTKELREAWGRPGEPGDPMGIRHVCKLIQDASERLVRWEEEVRFVHTPEDFDRLLACLPGTAGMQLDELSRVPGVLDEIVDWGHANPGATRTFEHTIVFELPDRWSERVGSELRRVERKMGLQ